MDSQISATEGCDHDARDADATLRGRLDRVRLLVSDLDGTLLDTEPLHIRSYEMIVTCLAGKITTIDGSSIIGKREPEIWRQLCSSHSLSAHPEWLQDLRRAVFLGLCADGDGPERDSKACEIVRAYGGPRVLLTSQSVPLAQRLLRRTGIAEVFGEVVSTQDAAVPSSKAEAMEGLMLRYGVAPGEVARIEDAAPDLADLKKRGVFLCVVKRDYNADAQSLADFVI